MGTQVYGPVKVLVGYGAEHSSLGALLNEVAAAADLHVPDPMPEEKSFYRSDHYFFVRKIAAQKNSETKIGLPVRAASPLKK